ncbi:hypothetical protein SBOR_9321 [Sclerotinia borealis F-4128]|uniref:Uncharacterized protein n=1 Tax=Sclerotinia borealis (strain F-4128) TaxID=1432307 RepID=W9C0I2_SCLBF|nr:hypothetical protein SBOR_9321 [Sclerotinia borealis F-4128]
MSSQSTVTEPTEPTVSPPADSPPAVSSCTFTTPPSLLTPFFQLSPELTISLFPPSPPAGSPSLPPDSRTWVPANFSRDTSWTPAIWIRIIGFVQDIHCMMLLGPFSGDSNIHENVFNVGFLNFARSFQHICQIRGAFVPGRRLVEAAWVARMSTYIIKQYSVSGMESLNECLWQTQSDEVEKYWTGMRIRYKGLDVQSHFNGAVGPLSELSRIINDTSLLQRLNMDKPHPPQLLVRASYLTFALSGRTYELTNLSHKLKGKAESE